MTTTNANWRAAIYEALSDIAGKKDIAVDPAEPLGEFIDRIRFELEEKWSEMENHFTELFDDLDGFEADAQKLEAGDEASDDSSDPAPQT